jgi:hypothetical protein
MHERVTSSEIVAKIAGDPAPAGRTWVLLAEAGEGGRAPHLTTAPTARRRRSSARDCAIPVAMNHTELRDEQAGRP